MAKKPKKPKPEDFRELMEELSGEQARYYMMVGIASRIEKLELLAEQASFDAERIGKRRWDS